MMSLDNYVTVKNKPTISYNPYAKTSKRIHSNNKKTNNVKPLKQTKIACDFNDTNNLNTDITLEPKLETMTRILYSNVNGIYTIHNNKLKEITDFMLTHQVDIMGMSETNTHWNDGNIYRETLTKIRHGLNDSKTYLYASDAKIPWKERYKPGGTASIISSTVNAQMVHKSNDYPLGRWNAMTLGPMGSKITIITAYIVGRTQIIPTKDKTAAYQQWQI